MLQNRAPLPVVSLADLSGDIPGRSDAVSQGIQDMKELDAHNVEENSGFASAQRGENGRLEIFENRTRTHRATDFEAYLESEVDELLHHWTTLYD